VPAEEPTTVPAEEPTTVPAEEPTTVPPEPPPPMSPKWLRDIGKPLRVSDPLLVLSSVFGEKTGTFGSKLYSTLGPIRNLTSVRGLVGYGLGGSPYHGSEFLSPLALKSFADNSKANRPTLKSLLGKIVSETGIVGTLLLGWVITVALIELRKIIRDKQSELPLALVAALSLVTLVFGSVTAFGSLALPYLWMALGITAALLAKTSSSEQIEN
jgi:hypothetical protein